MNWELYFICANKRAQYTHRSNLIHAYHLVCIWSGAHRLCWLRPPALCVCVCVCGWLTGFMFELIVLFGCCCACCVLYERGPTTHQTNTTITHNFRYIRRVCRKCRHMQSIKIACMCIVGRSLLHSLSRVQQSGLVSIAAHAARATTAKTHALHWWTFYMWWNIDTRYERTTRTWKWLWKHM